eukprot:CAMPEP_0172458404 /NCGR_PEP_ID=MMETSP1065-20121228/27429_1 /TAXON_ID=265537 /ORGANISM="Amphiprora paludosa, Strain CCMP125" /LENGTH=47 /DNA_ID= /DNA_START= /DNA_END= /DNA_ORIENTATION=
MTVLSLSSLPSLDDGDNNHPRYTWFDGASSTGFDGVNHRNKTANAKA